MESEDLPDTQPVEDSEIDTSFYPTQSTAPLDFWGRLYPLVKALRPVDLVENDLTLGNGGICIFTNDACSSLSEDICFKIKRKTVKTAKQWLKTVPEITNKGPIGILVNNNKINGCRKLCSNDVLSFPRSASSHYRAYVFIDCCNPVCDINVPTNISRVYQISSRLGAGAFGEVFLAFNKTSCHPLAMKTILRNGLSNNDDSKRHSKLLNELNVLRSVEHTHVIQLIDVIEYKQDHYIFLEYMEGNDLSERLKEKQVLTENIAKLYFYQICKGVQYLHSLGIIHRDIKPANVLLATSSTDTIIKLTDFGLSKILTPSTVMKTLCGTKMYAAPELLSGGGPYTSQVDVWSMGVLLYTCLAGIEPFSVAPHLIEKHIMRGLYVMLPDTWRKISVFAKNLVDVMLLLNPRERIDINEIFNDVWLQDPGMHARLRKIYNQFGIMMDD